MNCIIGGIWTKKEKFPKEIIKEIFAIDDIKSIDGLHNENFGCLFLGTKKYKKKQNPEKVNFKNNRYEIIFDGNIYNSEEIIFELKTAGIKLKKNSNQELALNVWVFWGESGLRKLIGAFSFAIYDKKENKIILIRDAFGSRPLLYSINKDKIIFSSDQEMFLKLKEGNLEANWQKSYDYLVHGSSGNPEHTFFQGVNNLNSASLIVIDLKKWKIENKKRWWSLSIKKNADITYEEAVAKTRKIFIKNIKLFFKDNPSFGVTLSGGIDSSSIVGAIKHLYPNNKINTFSYVVPGDKLSEEKWINKTVNFFGAKSYKISTNEDKLMQDLFDLIKTRSEPFGSTSIYGQYQIFKLANKKKISILLDGNGADLLMVGNFGYPGQRLLSLIESRQYLLALKFARNWSRWPNRPHIRSWMQLGQILLPKLIYTFARYLSGRNCRPSWINHLFLKTKRIITEEKRLKLSNTAHKRRLAEYLKYCTHSKLPIESLRHTQGISKRFLIESRTPFLTIEFAEFLFSLPEEYLISITGETKHVFRDAMKGILPNTTLKRKDKGAFETPEEKWLKNLSKKIRRIIELSIEIPIINHPKLLKTFDLMTEGKIMFSKQMWRWINYIIWYNLIVKKNNIKL